MGSSAIRVPSRTRTTVLIRESTASLNCNSMRSGEVLSTLPWAGAENWRTAGAEAADANSRTSKTVVARRRGIDIAFNHTKDTRRMRRATRGCDPRGDEHGGRPTGWAYWIVGD